LISRQPSSVHTIAIWFDFTIATLSAHECKLPLSDINPHGMPIRQPRPSL
jgi:hypothetical protein